MRCTSHVQGLPVWAWLAACVWTMLRRGQVLAGPAVPPAQPDARTQVPVWRWARACVRDLRTMPVRRTTRQVPTPMNRDLGHLSPNEREAMNTEQSNTNERVGPNPITRASRYLESRDEGTYYIGPLEVAKQMAATDREVHVIHTPTHYRVNLFDDPNDPEGSLAEFGSGITVEVAWRWALGAYFGPLDSEYPGDGFIDELITQATIQNIHFGFGVRDETEPHAGQPYGYLEVNEKRVLEFAGPWQVSDLCDMMMNGAMRLAIKMFAHIDGITEEAAEKFVQGIGQTSDTVPVTLIQDMLAWMNEAEGGGQPDAEVSAHCEDCGAWLDPKRMCPSCLPNSQRNPDERVED